MQYSGSDFVYLQERLELLSSLGEEPDAGILIRFRLPEIHLSRRFDSAAKSSVSILSETENT